MLNNSEKETISFIYPKRQIRAARVTGDRRVAVSHSGQLNSLVWDWSSVGEPICDAVICPSLTSQPFYNRSGHLFPCACTLRSVVVLRIVWKRSVRVGRRVNQNYTSPFSNVVKTDFRIVDIVGSLGTIGND